MGFRLLIWNEVGSVSQARGVPFVCELGRTKKSLAPACLVVLSIVVNRNTDMANA